MYHIQTDTLGTPRTITNATDGSLVWSWDNSEAFGNNSNNNTGLEFNLRFSGQYFDDEKGSSYNINRDYASGLGRYIQSDPIGLNGGINTYGYVQANPLSYNDPEGLDFKVVFEQTGLGHVLIGVNGDEFLISNYAKGYSGNTEKNSLGVFNTIKNIIDGDGVIHLDKQSSFPLQTNSLYKTLVIKTTAKQDEFLRGLVKNYQLNNSSRYSLLSYSCGGFVQDILHKSGVKTKDFNNDINFLFPIDLYIGIKNFNKETKEY